MAEAEERAGDVLYVVMAAIDDEHDGGSFATADLLRVIRRDLDPSPSSEEVTTALGLLALPTINGIRVAGNGWQAADPVEVVACRLQALADATADYRRGFHGRLDLDNRY